MARSFVWLTTGGGAWSLASNWDDVTDGADPSLLVPGTGDSVSVTGASGAQVATITGGGAAAAALFAGNTALSGAYAFGSLATGSPGSGGLLELAPGASLSAGSGTIAAGSLLAGHGSTLAVAGALALGTAGAAGATLDVTGGGAAAVLALLMGDGADSIYVDQSSVLEVGNAGGAAAGALTVDAGFALSGQGSANAYGSVVNNGTLAASGGTLVTGLLSGTGTLQVGAGATLELGGRCGAGQTVSFTGADGTLALREEAFAPSGIITGFVAGDAIDVLGSPISSASFAATGASGGVLTLFYGSQAAATLTLAGSYAGDAFLTAGDGAGGTLVTVAQPSGGGGSASPGTATPDQYGWNIPGSGGWNVAANWVDVTRGQSPAAIAPGANDLVTVAAGQGSFSVLTGPGNAASLSLTGEVGLAGAYALGTLTVGQASGTAFTSGTLDLLAGALLAVAGGVTVADGQVAVAGGATTLTVAGTLVLGGSAELGVGLPTASLAVSAGASVQAACLVMGGGSGATLTTDPTARVEVGTAGGAAYGAVTVDAGATLSGNGSVNPFGSIVNNGTVLAAGGGTLSLGAVSGTGSLTVAAGSTLELLATTPQSIALTGADATLALSSVRAAPTGVLTGFAPGDVIDVEGTALTGVQYAYGTTLLLYYGTTTVGRIPIGGSFTNEHFVFSPDGAEGTDITVVANSGGGGGPGQTGTDQLAWATPGSGNWSRAGSWWDDTTSKAATLPPGALTPVLLAGPTGTAFQSITGTGTCASLLATGNTSLGGTYAMGQVVVGSAASGMTPEQDGTVLVWNGCTLTASGGTIAAGDLLCQGVGAFLGVAGTLAVGSAPAGTGEPVALLAAGNHGMVQLGGLQLGGGGSDAVTVDTTASLEVGMAGGAAAGALTVDPGALASGNGTLNAYGSVVDNGRVEAEGGTLYIGAVSGSGTLGIGTEATLVLSGGTDTAPIAFDGGGATLVLPGSDQPIGAVITGFAPGDSIVTGSPVDSVAWTPGAGGVGTLTLSVGGQPAGQLLLAGSFAGEAFAVQPDGAAGAAIELTEAPSGPPPGTASPDAYRWTGAAGDGAWGDARNWTDVTQGGGVAAVAPGQNDLVSFSGGAQAPLAVTGPADAASLALTGTVSLAGLYAVGTVSVGAAGLLALGAGAALSAGAVQAAGGIAVGGGGALSVAGTLVLAAGGGVLAASGGSAVRLGGVALGGAGSVLAVDAASSIEVGGLGGATAGSITVDPGALLEGAGAVGLNGAQVVDDGTISAAGGTLALGAVSGTGTLLVAGAADLVLTGVVAPDLVADFSGGGTLTLATASGAPAIADFGTGETILLPVSGAAAASYAATGPGTGVLTVSDGSGNVLAQLTLLGSQAGRGFTVAGAPGGGTILTTEPDNTSGNQGGNPMSQFSTGQITRGDLLDAIAAAFPYVSQIDAGNLIGNEGIFVDDFTGAIDPSINAPDPLPTIFGAGYGGPGVNLEVVEPLSPSTVLQLGGAIAMQKGYSAVMLLGNESVGLTDAPLVTDPASPYYGKHVGLGDALLVGNYGNDTIAALGDGDTLVGAPGASTVFYASLLNNNSQSSLPIDVYVHGGGNDTIATNYDNAAITTSGGQSEVFLGASQNDVVSNGSDRIICGPYGTDTVTAQAAYGAGDTVFGPSQGILNFVGTNTPNTVVGNGGDIVMQGGNAAGSLLWAGNSDVEYVGGAGSAVIVAGTGFVSVTGGSAPLTVFGGTGEGVFSGPAGSAFVVGDGPTTVHSATGDGTWVQGPAPVSISAAAGNDIFAGGSTGNDVFQGGSGNETLWGGLGNDQFRAGSGNEILVSGGGQDNFNFTAGQSMGVDTVVGFLPGESTIALHGYGSQTPEMSVAWGDTVINLTGGTQIIVENVTNLTAANFTFS